MYKIIDIIIVFVFYIFSFLLIFNAKKIESKKHIILSFWVFLISIFLYFKEVGLDTGGYREYFVFYSNDSIFNYDFLKSPIEPFFLVLISGLNSIGLEFGFFQLIVGLFSLFVIIRVLYLELESQILIGFSLFILIFFLHGPSDVIRAFSASAMYLYALSSFSRGSKGKFFLKIFIAITLHYSSFISLVIYPFLRIKITFYFYLLLSLFVFLFGLFISSILNAMDFEYFSMHPIVERFVYYAIIYNSNDGYQFFNKLHFVLWWLLSLTFVFLVFFNTLYNLYYLYSPVKLRLTFFEYLVLKSQIYGTLFYLFLIGLGAFTIADRVIYFFSIGCFILIVKNVSNGFIINKNIFYYLFFIILLQLVTFIYLAGVFIPTSPTYIL